MRSGLSTNQRWAIGRFNNLGHCKRFAGTGDAKQDLVFIAGFHAAKKLTDRSGLIAARLIRAFEFERHER